MAKLFWIGLIGLLWLNGCSQTLDIPSFSIEKPRPIETIVLGTELGPKELKNLFKALNEKGQLNSLKSWFEEAPENGLKAWGKFFNRYLYQEAFHADGLLQILANRNSEKSFSSLDDRIFELTSTESFRLQKQTVFKMLSEPQIIELIERDVYWLDPKWQVDTVPFFSSLQKNVIVTAPTKDLFIDLRNLLSKSDFTQSLYQLNPHFEKTNLGHNLIRGLRNLNPNSTPEANPFIGFIKHLQPIFKTKTTSVSDFEKLTGLLKVLDQSSQGLFLSAEQTLKTETGEDLIRLFGERLEPILLTALSQNIEENLSYPFDGQTLTPEFWNLLPRAKENSKPTVQFVHLYKRIYASLTRFTHSSSVESDFTIGLNSYVLTRWMETLSARHQSQIKGEGILKLKIQAFDFSLNLLEVDDKNIPKKDANGKVLLANSVGEDLRALGLEEWTSDLEQLIKIQGFGKTLYVISKSNNSDFGLVLHHTIKRCHSVHPFADPVPLFTSVILKILHAESNKDFSIAQLETPNMLHSTSQFLASLTLTDLRRILHFVTDILRIDQLSSDDLERIRSLFPNNAEALKIVENILKNIGVLRAIDKSETNGISLLSFVHTLHRSVPSDSMEGMTELLRFIYRSTLFSVTFETPLEKNTLLNELLKSQFSGNILKALSELNTTTEPALLNGFRKSFETGPLHHSGLRTHLEFIRPFLDSNEAGLLALWDSTSQLRSRSLSDIEFKWLHGFIESRDFRELVTFLQNNSSQIKLFQLSVELELLRQKGGLRDAFILLGNIKNERMQRLALTLLQLEKSGELKALLSILNKLTKP